MISGIVETTSVPVPVQVVDSIEIEELVKQCCEQESTSTIQKKIGIALDISSSTQTRFFGRDNISDKIWSIASDYIISHQNDLIYIYSFGTTCVYHGNITAFDGYVHKPSFSLGGCTMTHYAIDKMIESNNRFDEIIIITDGETSSGENSIINSINEANKQNIKVKVIAVSCSETDMEMVTAREEQTIPGMDLVNYGKNMIDNLIIYNKFHREIPFKGVQNSRVDKNRLSFFGVMLPNTGDPVIIIFQDFFNNLLQKIGENLEAINWGNSHLGFKRLCSEIGKIFSVFFTEFSREHYFVQDIAGKLFSVTNLLSIEKIIDFFQYAYNCGRTNTPILYTNFDERVKDSVVKKQEFYDAQKLLLTYGTTLGCSSYISLPSSGYCILVKYEN